MKSRNSCNLEFSCFNLFSKFGIRPNRATGFKKTIAYHDPNHKWSTFNGQLLVTLDTPNTSSRKSEIIINLSLELFYIQANRDMITSVCKMDKMESTAN